VLGLLNANAVVLRRFMDDRALWLKQRSYKGRITHHNTQVLTGIWGETLLAA
jgi:hypothetical protein